MKVKWMRRMGFLTVPVPTTTRMEMSIMASGASRCVKVMVSYILDSLSHPS